MVVAAGAAWGTAATASSCVFRPMRPPPVRPATRATAPMINGVRFIVRSSADALVGDLPELDSRVCPDPGLPRPSAAWAVMVIVIVPEWLLYTGPIANWLPPSGVAVPPSEPADQVTFWTVAPLGSEAVTLTVSVCR